MSNHSNSIQLCGVAAYAPPIVFPNMDNHNRHCAPELIPPFLDPKFTSARTHNTHKNVNSELLQKMDWITPELKIEISSHFPNQNDIDTNGNRDKEKFKEHCELMFPVGRVFASAKQVHQVSKMLLDAWGVSCASTGKRISCHYGLRNRDKKEMEKQEEKERFHENKMKVLFDCQFHIKMSVIVTLRDHRKYSAFCPARITAVNLEHNHDLSTISHRKAMRRSGRLALDLKPLQVLLTLLREKPNLDSQTLRPLLLKHLPHYVSINSTLIRNLRLKAIAYWAIHDEADELTMDEAERVFDLNTPLASDDIISSDDPMTKINIKNILRKICTESKDMWMAISLLEKMKESTPGFDYRVKYTTDGDRLPEGIMYMSPRMRQDLIRYSDLMFLDAQCRQYNSSGFPYISPCMTDNENKICQGCEAIVVEESTSAYTWIINMMADIEPRFKKSSIRIIYGDGKVLPILLTDLGIQETCVLRGDKWHLTNAVWPDKFGSAFYPLIQNYLISMLDSDTQEQWEVAGNHARKKLEQYPHLCSFVDDILRNPSYYAGYYLKIIIRGSLGKNGSSAAESNHSSVVAYNGNGATWCIADHLHHLMTRCQNRSRQRDEMEQSHQLSVQRHKSTFVQDEAIWDKQARMILSSHAYEKMWKTCLLKSHGLQKQLFENGDIAIWPAYIESPVNHRGTRVIKNGLRCNCRFRTQYLSQCEHEILAHNGFHKQLFNHRWYNQWTYQCEVLDLNFATNNKYSSLTMRNMSRYSKHSNNEEADIDSEDSEDFQEDDQEDNINENIDDHEEDNIDEDSQDVDDDDEDKDDDDDDDDRNDHSVNQDNVDSSQQLLTQEDPYQSSYCWKPNSTLLHSSTSSSSEKLTYNQIVANFQTMASMIQHDQKELCRVNNSIDNLIQRYRRKHSVEIIIRTVSTEKTSCIVGTTNMNPTASFCSRKKGYREHQEKNSQGKRRRIMNATPSVAASVGQENDDQHMSRVKSLSKPCKLCQEAGHRGFMRCPKILKHCEPFGTSPFTPNCSSSRNIFVEKLIKDNGFVSGSFEETDMRNVCKSMPRNVKGLILHKRLIRHGRSEKGRGALGIIMEVTFLGQYGNPHSDYDQVLFELPVITKWILRSNNNILVSQLEEVLAKENTPSPKSKTISRSISNDEEPLKEIDGNIPLFKY